MQVRVRSRLRRIPGHLPAEIDAFVRDESRTGPSLSANGDGMEGQPQMRQHGAGSPLS